MCAFQFILSNNSEQEREFRTDTSQIKMQDSYYKYPHERSAMIRIFVNSTQQFERKVCAHNVRSENTQVFIFPQLKLYLVESKMQKKAAPTRILIIRSISVSVSIVCTQ